MGHPTRVHAVTVLHDREASPSQLAKELNCSIRHVSYHLKVLEKLGSIELVARSRPPRSESSRALPDDRPHLVRPKAWEQVADDKTRIGVTIPILSLMSEDIAKAMVANTFEEKDNHVSRTPRVLDDDGWDEVAPSSTRPRRARCHSGARREADHSRSRDENRQGRDHPVPLTPNRPEGGPRGKRAEPEAGATGLDPATSGVTGRRSNQLSYAPEMDRMGRGGPARDAKASAFGLGCRA